MPDYDVVVVGAGPAGATCAYQLAKSGFKTLLVDAKKLPRKKLCGGGLTPRTVDLLDFTIPDEIIQKRMNKVRLHYRDRHLGYDHKKPIITTVERSEFDHLLSLKAQEAGAELLEGFSVLSIEMNLDGSYTVLGNGKKFSCHIVVGADGVPSTVGKSVRPGISQDDAMLAYEMHCGEEDLDLSVETDCIDIIFADDAVGYGWVFPQKNGFSIGVGGVLKKFKDPQIQYCNFLKKIGYHGGIDYDAHLIPIGHSNLKVMGGGILLCGDAAGFGEPLSGEGMYFAIRSAQIAADVIIESKNSKGFDLAELSNYQKRCRTEFFSEFRRARKTYNLMERFKPYSFEIVLSNPELLEEYAKVYCGAKSYKDFKKAIIKKIPQVMLNTVRQKILQRGGSGK